jgi:hypothetical protein
VKAQQIKKPKHINQNTTEHHMASRKFSTVKFSALGQLAEVIQTGTRANIVAAIETARNAFSGSDWYACFDKLIDVAQNNVARFTIIKTDGNSKLPFLAFSTLPGVTCPGAGDCLQFCYSYRAWRYPAAFARQAQNAMLMRFAPEVIASAYANAAASRPDGFDFRLYVDGDFSSDADVAFWMATIRATPQARVYGYSKSFALLLAFNGQWPSNYLLNISSGHNSSADIVERVKALPITRGEFRAVSVGLKIKSADHGTQRINAALRAAVPEKIFPCPGKCGTCTGAGHACGMPALKGRVIAIAIH